MKAVHQRYTLILVTDELSPVRRMHLSRKLLRRATGAALVAGAVLAVGLVDYVRLRRDAVDVAALRIEAERHQGTLAALGSEVGALEDEVARIQELERKVRVIANLPGAMREARTPDLAGQGGAEEPAGDEATSGESATVAPSREPLEGVGAAAGAGFDAAGLARVQARAQQLRGEVPTRKLSLVELVAGLEGQSQRLAATPSIWPTSGYVTSGFGQRTSPFTGRAQFHAGLDIAADFGTPVIAPARGRVVFAGMDGPFGRKIELDHGYGLRTHYAHLAESGVKRGETVERGARIGAVGSTGRSTGPHLHYGVEVNGRSVNPTNYIFE